MPPTRENIAIANTPERNEPVVLARNPTITGPIIPPRFPVALISPIEDAELSPDRNSVGIVQKDGRNEKIPMAAITKNIIDTTAETESVSALITNPRKAVANTANVTIFRFPVLSEYLEISTRLIDAMMNGIALR